MTLLLDKNLLIRIENHFFDLLTRSVNGRKIVVFIESKTERLNPLQISKIRSNHLI